MKDINNRNTVGLNSEEPQVLYPHKVSPWKRFVPAAAAAAVLAAAIPVGVNTLGKRAEVSAPASPEISAPASGNALLSDNAFLPDDPADTAAQRAFKEFFRERYDKMRSDNPDAKAASGASLDDPLKYMKELDFTQTNDGFTVNVQGVIDLGSVMFVAFEAESEYPLAAIDIYAVSDFDLDEHDGKWLLGSAYESFKESAPPTYNGLYVSEVYFDELYTDHESIENIRLGFAPRRYDEGGTLIGILIQEIPEKGIVADLPRDIGNVPVLNTDVLAPGKGDITVNPLHILTVRPDSEYDPIFAKLPDNDLPDNRYDVAGFPGSLQVRLTMKDGSECFSIALSVGMNTCDTGMTFIEYDLGAPVNVDEIATIEAFGEIIYKAEDITDETDDPAVDKADALSVEEAIARYRQEAKPMKYFLFNGVEYDINEHGSITDTGEYEKLDYDNTFRAQGLSVSVDENGKLTFAENNVNPDVYYFEFEVSENNFPMDRIAYSYTPDGDVRVVLGDKACELQVDDGSSEGMIFWNDSETLQELDVLPEIITSYRVGSFGGGGIVINRDKYLGGSLGRKIFKLWYVTNAEAENLFVENDKNGFWSGEHDIFRLADGSYEYFSAPETEHAYFYAVHYGAYGAADPFENADV